MINLLNKFNEDWINFFEVSYDGIIVADKNGRIVYMNPAAEKLEEVNKSQIIGKLASDLEKEGIYEKSVTVMVLKEKRAVSVKQCKGDKQLIITGVPLFEDNAIKWIYINERDATELNKIKQEIDSEEKKVKDLKQLGYNIYDRDISSDIYNIENTTEFYLTGSELYLIYAYGNDSQTSEKDLVIL